jgi:hypothetical protein
LIETTIIEAMTPEMRERLARLRERENKIDAETYRGRNFVVDFDPLTPETPNSWNMPFGGKAEKTSDHRTAQRRVDRFIGDIDARMMLAATVTPADSSRDIEKIIEDAGSPAAKSLEAEYTAASNRVFIADDSLRVNDKVIAYTQNLGRGQSTSGAEAEARRASYAANEPNQDREAKVNAMLQMIAKVRETKTTKLYKFRSRRNEGVTKQMTENEDLIPNRIAAMLEHPEFDQKFNDEGWVTEQLRKRDRPSYDALDKAISEDDLPISANAVMDAPTDYSSVLATTPELTRAMEMREAIESGTESKEAIIRRYGFNSESTADRWVKDQLKIARENVLDDPYNELVIPHQNLADAMNDARLDMMEADRAAEQDERAREQAKEARKLPTEVTPGMTTQEKRALYERNRRARLKTPALRVLPRRPVVESILATV